MAPKKEKPQKEKVAANTEGKEPHDGGLAVLPASIPPSFAPRFSRLCAKINKRIEALKARPIEGTAEVPPLRRRQHAAWTLPYRAVSFVITRYNTETALLMLEPWERYVLNCILGCFLYLFATQTAKVFVAAMRLFH